MYDVVIIGAGPSGASLARFLDKQYRVLLIDKRNLDEWPPLVNKCCGGLLAPDAQNILGRLGLGVPGEVLTGPQLFSVRTVDRDHGLERYYQRYYINIDREKFDRWLCSALPEHAEKKFNTLFLSYRRDEEGLIIKYREEGIISEIRTKILVGADGAASRVRRQADPAFGKDSYLALQYWFKTQRESPFYTSIFDRTVTDFYSWIIQKNGHLLVGSALPPGEGARQKFEGLVDRLKGEGMITGEPVKKESAFINRPRDMKSIRTHRGEVAFTGEAAGFISPSSAEGISYAIKSGLLLAESINTSFPCFQKVYRNKTAGLKFNIWLKNRKLPFMYNRALRRLILASGIFSMKIR
ncbi:MAG TPA: FAD-binding protein [Candidatus Mcinerneyibacteriales bacterium]|nr:FAD-binding protein [Candidatus Mcinerneyibacteriales bacterium]HPQ89358.1 FAD-binding protein [Candidatus Mcinerneyibacteriales bacterium]